MPFIHSVKTGVPKHYYTQDQVYDYVSPLLDERAKVYFSKLLQNSNIDGRYFCATAEEIINLCINGSPAQKFKKWEETSYDFLKQATLSLLSEAGLEPNQIDGICSNSSSGFIMPGLDVQLMNDLPFRHDVRRMPFFGFGCVGGVAGVNHVSQLLDAHPKGAYLFFSVETLSMLMEPNQSDIANLVKTSLFSDGFAILLMVGDEHPLAQQSPMQIINTKSAIIKESAEFVYQFMGQKGIETYVDAKLPQAVEKYAAGPGEEMLDESEISAAEIEYWICHAGGPRILKALSKSFDVDYSNLTLSEQVYKSYGNMSSVSVLMALEATLSSKQKQGHAMMLGLGPGISIEYTLCKVRA